MSVPDFFATFLADALSPPSFADVWKSGFGFDTVKAEDTTSSNEEIVSKDEDMSSFYEEVVSGIFEDDATGDLDNGGIDDIQMGTDWSAPPSPNSMLFGVGWSIGGLSPFACG